LLDLAASSGLTAALTFDQPCLGKRGSDLLHSVDQFDGSG
jgi:hypothetical protein